MELERDVFGCEWCGRVFPRRCRTGRRPLYCRRTCRQRAYEHRRRAALPQEGPSVPGPPRATPPTGYAAGMVLFGRLHALRPVGAPDVYGRRPTLCGTAVRATRPHFSVFEREVCRTCVAISRKYAAPWPADTSNELAALRAHYATARATLVRLDRAVDADDVRSLAATARQAIGAIVGPAWPAAA